MKTTITLSLHKDYVNVVMRFHKQTFMSHVEYAFCGASAVGLIKKAYTRDELERKASAFVEEHRDVKKLYLSGFKGHFTFTYKLTNNEDITEFEVEHSRCINESRGGRSVSGAFKDKLFRKKIFMNLLNAAHARDVEKLNSVVGALYTIGG